ncbi:MAG: hypothetical protein LBJ72_09990 [Dysgonamonadaceae bacterium]|jgi:hypothetical protein|nr:hypothetical protein [Dysgonamonadaceae bacterium]
MKNKPVSFVFCLCFVSLISAQTPQELKSYLPPVQGWTITDDIEVFNRENLFQRINGAAPLYLENNFQEMTSMVYTKGEDYITIQAYRHATSIDAFGMYASERSSEMTFYDNIGGEAQGDNTGLFCFAGCVYLKIQANNESEEIAEALRTIAKGLTLKIDPDASYPGLFRYFPLGSGEYGDYKIPHSEAYITSNYIGHEFLKGVYTCNYRGGDIVAQLFAIDAQTGENAREIVTKYFEFTKQQTEEIQEGKSFIVEDKYNGDIPCVWNGRYILGVFNEKGIDLNEYGIGTLLEQLIKSME